LDDFLTPSQTATDSREPLPPPPAGEVSPPTPAAPRPRLHPLARTGLFLAAYIAVQVIVAIFLGILAYATGGEFRKSSEFLLLAVALGTPLIVAVTFAFVRGLDRRPVGSIGARWPEGGRPAALRQAVTVPLATLALLGAWLAGVLALPSSLATVRFGGTSEVFASGPSWWPAPPALLLVVLLLGFLVQGGLEEWVLRGYVYRALKDRWRPWVAAIASSILFSLLHATNPSISALALFNIFLAGMILAALVERSGSLWGATLAHGVWNFSVACLLSVPVSGLQAFHLFDVSFGGDDVVTGGEFGPEGSLVLTALGLLLSAVLWRRTQPRPLRGIGMSTPEDI
jgi:membrane protease YdiL (CAAX protease family)